MNTNITKKKTLKIAVDLKSANSLETSSDLGLTFTGQILDKNPNGITENITSTAG